MFVNFLVTFDSALFNWVLFVAGRIHECSQLGILSEFSIVAYDFILQMIYGWIEIVGGIGRGADRAGRGVRLPGGSGLERNLQQLCSFLQPCWKCFHFDYTQYSLAK